MTIPPPPPPAGLGPDARAVVRAAEALTTQVRRIADAITTPVAVIRDGVLTPLEAEAPAPRRAVALATPCVNCTHPYNWHAGRTGCEFGNETNRCGCTQFSPGQRPEPVNPWHILGAQHPAEHCEHDGPHPGFTCGEVDQTRLFWEAEWAREAGRKQPAAPAAEEDAQRTARRASMVNLLARAERMALSPTDAGRLREHVETEIRDADTARSVAAGNKCHVQVMYGELEQERTSSAGLVGKVRELRVQLETADQTRAEAQRDRDQHAAVLNEVLAAFVHKVEGYRVPRRSAEVDVATLEKWRSVIAPTVERPWWVDVAEIRAELKEEQGAIERVRHLVTGAAQTTAAGISDHDIGRYDMAVAVLAALDGTEQPTTEVDR